MRDTTQASHIRRKHLETEPPHACALKRGRGDPLGGPDPAANTLKKV